MVLIGEADDFADSMQPVVEAVGRQIAWTIAKRFGGSNIYIAKEPVDNSPLVLLVGHQAARALAQRLGHGLFYVAQCRSAERAARNAEIVARYAAGEPLNSLVQSFGLSRVRVLQILSGADVSEPRSVPASRGAQRASATFDLFNTAADSAAQEN